MVAYGLEQAKGTCTFDFKPLGLGLLGKEQKSTGKFIHNPYTESYYSIGNPFFYKFDYKGARNGCPWP